MIYMNHFESNLMYQNLETFQKIVQKMIECEEREKIF